MTNRYEILECETAYQGFFRLSRYRIRHGLFDGGMSESLTRELFERGNAVAVMPYDPARDEVVLVEQFRMGALEAPRGPWLIEIIAGIIEAGESPEDVAVRESIEEADCRLDEMFPVYRYLVSPGGSSEQTALFCARVDTSEIGGVHGKADEGEDIRVHVVPFGQAIEMIEDGSIHSATPIIGLQWLALNRDRLREMWLND